MHGPYWYWKFSERVGTKYLGKKPPVLVSETREWYKKLAKLMEDSALFLSRTLGLSAEADRAGSVVRERFITIETLGVSEQAWVQAGEVA